MMDDTKLVGYIKESLGSKQTVQAVITSLEAEGYSQEQIDTAFRLALRPGEGAPSVGRPSLRWCELPFWPCRWSLYT